MPVYLDPTTPEGVAAIELEAGKRKLAGLPHKVVFAEPESTAHLPKTDKQRSAAHIWFREVADTLNDAGLERVIVIKALQERGLDMPWDGESFKADVYKPVFQKVARAESTEDANRTDHSICYEGMTRWFAQKFGVTLPLWPRQDR